MLAGILTPSTVRALQTMCVRHGHASGQAWPCEHGIGIAWNVASESRCAPGGKALFPQSVRTPLVISAMSGTVTGAEQRTSTATGLTLRLSSSMKLAVESCCRLFVLARLVAASRADPASEAMHE